MSSLFRNGALAAKLGSSKVGNRTLGLSNGSLLLVSYIGMLFLLLVFAGSLYLSVGSLLTGWIDLPYTVSQKRIGLIISCGIPAAALVFAAVIVGLSKEPLPEGIYVTESTGNSLRLAVHQVARAAGTPVPDHIVLTEELNAFAGEVAENGPFRRKTTVLGLGLPLLKLLSLEQAGAVIAHEMGHFASRDNHASRVHSSMEFVAESVVEQCEASSHSLYFLAITWPLKGFLHLAGRFQTGVSRANEYRADAVAAELFGERHAADALIVLDVLGREFDEWLHKPLNDAWNKGEELPQSFTRMTQDAFNSAESRAELERRVNEAMKRKPGKWDRHPCLKDRLQSLGVELRFPSLDPARNSGAAALLMEDEEKVQQLLDAEQRKKLGEKFGNRVKDVSETRALTARLYADLTNLNAGEAETLSLLLERSIDAAEARAMHEEIIARFGPIPSSVCEIAKDDIRQRKITGVEALLNIFESRPLMSGEAQKFLGCAYESRADLPHELQLLSDWLADKTVLRRIEDGFKAYNAVNEKKSKFFDSKPTLKMPDIAGWQFDLVIDEVCKKIPAKRIWLAEFESLPEVDERMFSLLVEIDEGVEPNLLNGIGSRMCLPGTLLRDAATSMKIGLDAKLRHRRNFAQSLIYEADGAGLRQAA